MFTATASADTAHVTITVVNGAGQTGGITSALPNGLSIRLTDQFGNPVVGDTVTWTDSIGGGGKVSTSKVATDATRRGPDELDTSACARADSSSGVKEAAARRHGQTFLATATVAFSDVFAGNFMACGIAAANNLTYCWGVGDGGQLGKGLNSNTSVPTTPVATTSDSVNGPFLQIRQMSGGNDGFCAITIDRRLYCWGRTIGA